MSFKMLTAREVIERMGPHVAVHIARSIVEMEETGNLRKDQLIKDTLRFIEREGYPKHMLVKLMIDSVKDIALYNLADLRSQPRMRFDK